MVRGIIQIHETFEYDNVEKHYTLYIDYWKNCDPFYSYFQCGKNRNNVFLCYNCLINAEIFFFPGHACISFVLYRYAIYTLI